MDTGTNGAAVHGATAPAGRGDPDELIWQALLAESISRRRFLQ